MNAKRALKWLAGAGLALLWAAPVVRAQSLGEAAQREKARREGLERAGRAGARIVTGEDLELYENQSTPGSSDQSASNSSSPAVASSSWASSGGANAETDADKSYWRDRIDVARTAVEQAEQRVRDAEAAVREARARAAADYNAGLWQVDERRSLDADYDTAKRDLQDARKTLASVMSDARQAGALSAQ